MLQNITLSVIYTITFILCLILLRVQIKVQRLRHNPGQILLGIVISELLLCLLTIFSQFYVVTDNKENYQIQLSFNECKLLAIPSLIIFMIYNILNVLLIGNLYCQIYAKNYREFNIKKEIVLIMILIVSVSVLSVLISQDLGVSILGDCNLESENVFSTFIVYLRGILMIILSSILIKLLKYTPEILYTEIYKTLIDKFIRKYLQTYIKVNVSYGLLYVIARLLIPIIINYSKENNIIIMICQYIQAILTLIMIIIRLHEPIVHRHAKYLFRSKKCVLQERLLENPRDNSDDYAQKSYENIQIQNNGQDISSIEIKVYKQQQKNGSISLSLEQFQPLTLLPQESAYNNVLPINFIQHQGHELLQQLIECSYNILEDYQYNLNEEMNSYQFNKIQQKEIQNQYGLKILITIYGQDILSLKMRDYFGVTLKQFKNSIDITKNKESFQIESLPESGTILITHDNLISIEFVTKDQKRQLTKGGGLQLLWQRFEQEFNCPLGIFVPVIIGLHSFYVNDEYFTIIYKLNRLKIRYPLIDDLWSNEQLIKDLIKQNIIGWITIEDGIFYRRFLAKEVQDGQYQINFLRNDFLLNENDKQSLIDMIKRDYQTMQQMKSSLTLQFVYTKHTSARLNSLSKKEKQYDQDQSIDSQKQIKNKIIGNMASFELKTKLGYLEVFWDNCWKYQDSELEKIIDIVNERF